MNPDIEGLKSYIGGLVLDIFTAKGEINRLNEIINRLASNNPPIDNGNKNINDTNT